MSVCARFKPASQHECTRASDEFRRHLEPGRYRALATASCIGIAANIVQSFSISTLSIRGRATHIMLTLCSYTTDLTLVTLRTSAEMVLRFNSTEHLALAPSRNPIQQPLFACKTVMHHAAVTLDDVSNAIVCIRSLSWHLRLACGRLHSSASTFLLDG